MTSTYCGIRVASAGIMSVARKMMKMTFFPLKESRANA